MSKQSIRILLIDDEEEFATTLAERLELRGYKTRTASSGEDGLTLLVNEHFDVAVLDLMMPGMSGLDALQHIKSDYPNMPVVLLTGHGSTKEGMEGMRLGAYDYLMKPLDIKDLTLIILKAVEASGGDAS